MVGGFTWLSTLDYFRILNQEVSARLGGRHSAKIVLTMTEDFWIRRMAERHGIQVMVLPPQGIQEIDAIIFKELAAGRFEEKSKRICLREIDRLIAAGVEGIVLGCTELQLLVSPADTPALLFDTLALHAGAAADRALAV